MHVYTHPLHVYMQPSQYARIHPPTSACTHVPALFRSCTHFTHTLSIHIYCTLRVYAQEWNRYGEKKREREREQEQEHWRVRVRARARAHVRLCVPVPVLVPVPVPVPVSVPMPVPVPVPVRVSVRMHVPDAPA